VAARLLNYLGFAILTGIARILRRAAQKKKS
jgi:hypothetical protein